MLKTAIGTHPKSTITALIADEIHWHNLKESELSNPIEINKLKEQARKLGEEYFIANLEAFLSPLNIEPTKFLQEYGNLTIGEQIKNINQLAKDKEINYEICTWSNWIKDHEDTCQKYQDCYADKHSSKLYVSINKTASDFARRHTGQTQGPDYDQSKTRSRGYLSEESFAIMGLALLKKYAHIAYPGTMITPFADTQVYLNKQDEFQSLAPVSWVNIGFSLMETPDKYSIYTNWQATDKQDIPSLKKLQQEEQLIEAKVIVLPEKETPSKEMNIKPSTTGIFKPSVKKTAERKAAEEEIRKLTAVLLMGNLEGEPLSSSDYDRVVTHTLMGYANPEQLVQMVANMQTHLTQLTTRLEPLSPPKSPPPEFEEGDSPRVH